MLTKPIPFIFTFLLLISADVFAQVDEADTEISVGSSFFLNPSLGEDLPFWLHVHRNGAVDQYSSNALIYSSISSNLYQNDIFSFDVGANVIARYSDDPSLFFNILYAETKLGGFKLTGGRFTDPLAEKEDDLSIGSFIVSNNATPVPKIAIQTDDFISVPFTEGIVRYNGFYSHGWFENDRFTQDVYLHQKHFYLSIKYAFFDAVGGIVHNAQWGGENPVHGKLPSDFQAYLEVVTTKSASSETAPGGERSNVIGNSLAAYDFSLGLFFKDFDMRAYRLFYLEDKVSTGFRSPWDGIWGVTIKPKNKPILQNFLIEHINTKRQDSFEHHPYGRARYYNHFVYRSGWNYHNRVIGMPLISFNRDGALENNIMIAYNLGISGALTTNLNYKLQGTFSRNYGTCFDQVNSGGCYYDEDERPEVIPLDQLRKDQYSIYLKMDYTLPEKNDWKLFGGISTDIGELYDKRVGFEVGVQWSGNTSIGF